METRTEYLIFFKIMKPNHKTYHVSVANKNYEPIGVIKWHGAWRKYCFFPEDGCLFDTKCLKDIVDYITKLMEERKKK